jgi:hypothetical protein
MGLLGDLMKTVSDVVTGGRRSGAPSAHGRPARERARPSRADAEVLPGEFGPDTSMEVDPHRIGPVRTSYSPQTDGAPDPGEVVWTWVPFEENDGRGKDRPVLVVGRDGDALLALMLSSKDHDVDAADEGRHGRHWVDVGTGAWDRQGRPSEVRVDRVLRIDPADVRREGATLDRDRFDDVAAEVHRFRG